LNKKKEKKKLLDKSISTSLLFIDTSLWVYLCTSH